MSYTIHFIWGEDTDEGFIVRPENDYYEDHTAESLEEKLNELATQDNQGIPLAILKRAIADGFTCVMMKADGNGFRVMLSKEPGFVGIREIEENDDV